MAQKRKYSTEQAAVNALNEIAAEYHVTLNEMAEKRGISVERMISNYQQALDHGLNFKKPQQ